MTIIIAPFTIDPDRNSIEPQVWSEEEVKERHARGIYQPITYWGVYMDDKYISHTSSR